MRCIKNIPSPKISYIETSVSTYSMFRGEEKEPCTRPKLKEDQIWKIHFDGVSSIEGNGTDIIFFSPSGNPHNFFFFRLNFQCTNNIAEFRALSLGL